MAAIHESLEDSIKHWYECEGGKRAVKGAIGKIETSCNIVGPAALSGDLSRQFSRERYEQLRKNLISNSDLSNKKGDVESKGKHGFLDLLKTYYGVLGIATIAPIYIINKEELKLLKRGTLSYSGLNYGKENGNVSLKENILKTYSDFSRDVSDFLTGGAVAVDNNFTFGGVKKLNGYDENQPHSKAYKIGKYTLDSISIAVGAGTTFIGGLMGGAGVALSSTGVGALAGVPLSAAGVGAITYGGTVIVNSAQGIADDGRSLMSGDGGSSKENTEQRAKNLLGKEFEDYLNKELDGEGSRQVGGRDFDGVKGNRWWEAKSGQYWEMLESNSKKLSEFKSDMGDRLKIAKQNGATYELFSNTPIPQSIKDWLTKKGIPFTEILD
jgi:hypothetical protein